MESEFSLLMKLVAEDELEEIVRIATEKDLFKAKNDEFISLSGRLAALKKREMIAGSSQSELIQVRDDIRDGFRELIQSEVESSLRRNGNSDGGISKSRGGGSSISIREIDEEMVELTIREKLKNYTLEKKIALLRKIAILLGLDDLPNSDPPYEGSVKLVVYLEPGKARELIELIDSGGLQEFEVVSAKILPSAGKKGSTDISGSKTSGKETRRRDPGFQGGKFSGKSSFENEERRSSSQEERSSPFDRRRKSSDGRKIAASTDFGISEGSWAMYSGIHGLTIYDELVMDGPLPGTIEPISDADQAPQSILVFDLPEPSDGMNVSLEISDSKLGISDKVSLKRISASYSMFREEQMVSGHEIIFENDHLFTVAEEGRFTTYVNINSDDQIARLSYSDIKTFDTFRFSLLALTKSV